VQSAKGKRAEGSSRRGGRSKGKGQRAKGKAEEEKEPRNQGVEESRRGHFRSKIADVKSQNGGGEWQARRQVKGQRSKCEFGGHTTKPLHPSMRFGFRFPSRSLWARRRACRQRAGDVGRRLTAHGLRLRRRAGLVGGWSRATGGSPSTSAGVFRPRSVRSKSASKLTSVRSCFSAATYW